jgi:hypothetical protein
MATTMEAGEAGFVIKEKTSGVADLPNPLHLIGSVL